MKNKTSKMTIFLDYNATVPMRIAAKKSILEAIESPLNASSVHSLGREGRKKLEHARETLAQHLAIPASQIIFNSGATEGNNTVLQHFSNDKVITSAIEHPAVLEAVKNAIQAPVNTEGQIDLSALEELLIKEKPALVSIMAINNETGVIQPIKEASALIHRHGALFHCDAAQALGKINLNMQELGIDFLTLSAHKVGGPQGTGALAIGFCGITPTLLHGGGQEKSARGGTENVAGISGFGAALTETLASMDQEQERLKNLKDKLETELAKIEGITIHGQSAPRANNTTLFSLKGTSSDTLLISLDLDGFCVSNGSACSSGKVKISHVLKAMGVDNTLASATIRISTGWKTTLDDIENFIEAFKKIAARVAQ